LNPAYHKNNFIIPCVVDFKFNYSFEDIDIKYNYLINCAGLYADKIAKRFGLSKKYTIMPFRGLYLKYIGNKKPIKMNVYPVPLLENPFLGVHFTVTSNGDVRIGPTATPAFWKEDYSGFSNFNFRKLAFKEILYLIRSNIFKSAKKLVYKIDNNFTSIKPGIRAQLLNKETNELVQDFVLEHTKNSTHILNAVSPGFTCSFSFAEYVVDEISNNLEDNL